MKETARRRFLLVAAIIVVITFLYYAMVPQYTHCHALFSVLYFLPLILAAVWFGLKGALAFSLTVSLFHLPFVIRNWQTLSPDDLYRILEILLVIAVTAILGTISDREKIREKVLRESENLEAMKRTLGMVAHDIRSPLTAIEGFTRSLQKKLQLDNDSRAKMDLIVGETNRLEIMLKDMLDFSKPLQLRTDSGDVNEVLRRTLLLVEKQAASQKVRLKIDLRDDIPPIRFDPYRMEQVFLNLLNNALEASPPEETVSVRTYVEEDQVCLDVVDHGPGIPAEHRDQIFAPFFTTKRYGCGLGLAIAIQIIHAHKGRIQVRKTDNGGATFKVSLPVG